MIKIDHFQVPTPSEILYYLLEPIHDFEAKKINVFFFALRTFVNDNTHILNL